MMRLPIPYQDTSFGVTADADNTCWFSRNDTVKFQIAAFSILISSASWPPTHFT